MQLTVVIPTHQRPTEVKALLRSLSRQDLASEVGWEVLVISNLADSKTQEVIEEFQCNKTLPVKGFVVGQVGVNRARNLGLDNALGRLVLFLDDDCLLPRKSFLSEIILAHAQSVDVAAIGGLYILPLGASAVAATYNLISTRWLLRTQLDTGEPFQLVGGNICYKREVLDSGRYRFDENIVFGGSETELHLRLVKAGHKLLLRRDLSVIHSAQMGLWEFLYKGFRQGRSAQARWREGLFVPSRPTEEVFFESSRPWVRRLESWFHLSFELGREFEDKSYETASTPSLAFFLVQYLLLQLWQKLRNFAKVQVTRFVVRGRGRYICEPPLARLVKATAEDLFDLDSFRSFVGRCKRYGYNGIQVDDSQWADLALLRGFFAVAKEQNTELYVSIDLTKVDRLDWRRIKNLLALGVRFHFAVGGLRLLQTQVFEFFLRNSRTHGTPLPLLTIEVASSRNLRNTVVLMPPEFRRRLHYAFPERVSEWHPRPSCQAIFRSLKKAAASISLTEPLVVRGPLTYSSLSFASLEAVNVAPDLEPTWTAGQHSGQVDFSIVIPTFNSAQYLAQVLRWLRLQNYSPERFEVVIVDDASTDDTLQALKNVWAAGEGMDIPLRYFYWPNDNGKKTFRAGRARNIGVANSVGKYILFIDSDILLPTNYLSELELRFRQADVIQARREMLTAEASLSLQPGQVFDAGDTYREDAYWEDFKRQEEWTSLKSYWKYTCTYCLALRKSDFVQAGGFSNEFTRYGFEDVDLGFRLMRLGKAFVLSSQSVHHLHPQASPFSHHFDQFKRESTLTLSSRLFFRQRLDPAIYSEFHYSYSQSWWGELKVRWGQNLGVMSHYYWVQFHWQNRGYYLSRQLINLLGPFQHLVLKPYYFLEFQFQKRFRGRHGV